MVNRCWLKLLTIAVVAQTVGACSNGVDLPTAPAPTAAPSPTIRAIHINGPSTIAWGQSAQFTARADYSDGTSADITASASWTTSHPSVVTVEAGGKARGSTPGEAQLSAFKDGIRSSIPVLVVGVPGTYRLSGRILIEGKAYAGLEVHIVSGAGAEAKTWTDWLGQYVLNVVAGAVEIQVWTDGFPLLSCAAVVADHAVLDIDLTTSGPLPAGCRRAV